MSDTKQAAERLRRLAAGESWVAIYGDAEDSEGCLRDRFTVANAFLAEHAADDDEPITEEWWHSQCCVETITIPIDDDWYISWNGCSDVWLHSDSDALPLPHITTRGQLKLLLRALGLRGS